MTNAQLRQAAAGIAAAMLLAGCGGAQSAALPNAGAFAPNIVPAAKARDLLYVSSTWGGGIYVTSYPDGKPVGHIPYDGGPYGLCSDAKGNVYAMGVLSEIIVEYAHGGIDPIATLNDAPESPEGCAVDPGSGNLAVADGGNEIQIYTHGRGTPTNYSGKGVYSFFFCTYDDKGNLFTTAENYAEQFMLEELPKGSSALQSISVPGSIPTGYAIQWDGKYVALQASTASGQTTIDRLSIAGSSAKIVSSTTLDGTSGDELPAQFWIAGGKLALIEGNNADVGIWKYPAGGEALKTLDGVGSGLLIGVTVSR